jgi:hypothetical protein
MMEKDNITNNDINYVMYIEIIVYLHSLILYLLIELFAELYCNSVNLVGI